MSYGTKGSGKTHSMFGSKSDPGIVQLTLRELVERRPEVSVIQVFKEGMVDLLTSLL